MCLPTYAHVKHTHLYNTHTYVQAHAHRHKEAKTLWVTLWTVSLLASHQAVGFYLAQPVTMGSPASLRNVPWEGREGAEKSRERGT